jgi:Arc/MetJ family transcription regulator
MCSKVLEQTAKHTERETLGINGFRESNDQLLTPMEEAVKVRGKENTWKKWNEAKEKSGAYSKGRCSKKEKERKLLEGMEGGKRTITCLLQWIAAKKETRNKTLERNGLRERNTQVTAAVEDAVKKEEGRKLLEGMDRGKGTIGCLLQRKMQSKGRGKKTLGSDGRGATNNQVLAPMEDAAEKEVERKHLEGKE